MAIHYPGRIIGSCLITGSLVFACITYQNNLVAENLENSKSSLTDTSPQPKKPQPKVDRKTSDLRTETPVEPGDTTSTNGTNNSDVPIPTNGKNPNDTIVQTPLLTSNTNSSNPKFAQPTFQGAPDLVQAEGKYEIRIPNNWEPRKNDRAKDNSAKFDSLEYTSKSMSKDYQGEMYVFNDGSWIKFEKTNFGITIEGSPSKADRQVRVYGSTKRNMGGNQDELFIFNQNQGKRTMTLNKSTYVFTDLLR